MTSLFAPADRREALFVLIAFNHELVRALEMPSVRSGAGPIASLIRLQWWREVVEGEPRRHEVAEPLAGLLSAGAFTRETLLAVIDAREAEAEGIETLQDWQALQLGGPGGMQVAFGEALGERDPGVLARLRAAGAAYAAGSILRHHLAIVKAGRCPFPDDLLHHAGSSRDTVLGGGATIDATVLAPLRDAGLGWLGQAGRLRLGRSRVAAALPAVFARRDLRRSPAAGASSGRGVGDRLALTAAWLRGSP